MKNGSSGRSNCMLDPIIEFELLNKKISPKTKKEKNDNGLSNGDGKETLRA